EVELRNQGAHRRDGALAALTRTDWEIAHQEVSLAVRTLRTFKTVLYRNDKLKHVEATLRLNQDALERVRKLQAVRLRRADLRLALADRYGNPTVGPNYEYDNTRVNYFGAQVNVPLPIFNTHRGDVQQREAERARAALELRQTEVQVRQDVQAALARLSGARASVNTYRNEVLPSLRTSLQGIEKLFEQAEPNVDVL